MERRPTDDHSLIAMCGAAPTSVLVGLPKYPRSATRHRKCCSTRGRPQTSGHRDNFTLPNTDVLMSALECQVERSFTTQRSRRRLSRRATGPPCDLPYTGADKQMGVRDSGRLRAPPGDHTSLAAERLRPKVANSRNRPIPLKNSTCTAIGTFAGVLRPLPRSRSSIFDRAERSNFAESHARLREPIL